MCVGLPKPAEHLVLAALFFGHFFCASKRKEKQFVSRQRKERNKRIFYIALKKEGTLTIPRSGATYYRDIHLSNGSHGSLT
jgi:hypothetical protein